MDINRTLSDELGLTKKQIDATVALIDEGNTIPFIARYRKEVTGSVDDGTLRLLYDRLNYLRGFDKRRSEIKASIAEQGKLTDEISVSLDNALTLTELEDIYRPFKPHRKTRASVARERGLEDLALILIMQEEYCEREIEEIAADFINEEKEVCTIEDALNGACDIIAEDISDNAEYRHEIRDMTFEYGFINSVKTKDVEKSVPSAKTGKDTYEQYYEYNEKISNIPEHRILALNRAENEGIIKFSVEIDTCIPLNFLYQRVLEPHSSPAMKYVSRAVIDSYSRLIAPSIEREIKSDLFDRASEGAIKLFAENLKNLLMQAPVRGFVVMGLDPGYRTGCKLAVVDKTGKVIDTAVIYPTKPFEKIPEAKAIVLKLIKKYNVNIIAIGNGTASRESEMFIADVLREIKEEVKYIIVSEAGASVYSVSETGAKEFPDFDVTQRSAVSIARRLQDPLAELIKIDPKSIGVGQYQHDMKPNRLGEALGGVVEDCVNKVGVDLNTASGALLSYVAGIGEASAKNIVKYREENGEFKSRVEVLKVPRIGKRAYEQCAGFLRVPASEEIFDNTGVHPESYKAAKELLALLKINKSDLKNKKTLNIASAAQNYGIEKLCLEIGIGEPTLKDIINEMDKPGRDPRDSLPAPEFRSDILDIKDLSVNMLLTGTVRNVIDFGAFVDIGVHQDGLVHISQMSTKFIKHPSEVVSVGDIVSVRILSVDTERGKISLTMKI